MSACGEEAEEGQQGTERVSEARATGGSSGSGVDPDDFVDEIDNPFLPLEPGTRFRYEGSSEEGTEVGVVEVTDRKKKILGVSVTVVKDTVSLDGEVIEETLDWYAQDRDGNVWYFGEDTEELENGEVVSTEGSWEAGVDDAEPGIVMEADPQVGDTYDQEMAPDVAEDRAKVLSLDESVEVGTGSYDNVLQTEETTPLEPDVVEHKFYAKDVGLLMERQVKGGEDRLELVRIDRP